MRLRSINPPCVPFAGTYLSQIFFFEQGRSTYVQPDNELKVEDVSFAIWVNEIGVFRIPKTKQTAES